MKLIPVLFMAAAVVSCGTAKKTADATPVDTETVATMTSQTLPADRSEVMKKPDVSLEQVEFAMNFLKTAIETNPKGNVVLSPFSAGMAFSMLTDGARGATRDGLVKALCRSSYYGEHPYTDSLNIVKVANSIWLNHGFDAKDDYIKSLQNGYGAQLYSADAGDPFTVDAVNKWCSDHTEGMIKGILDELPPTVRMILMNALYFKAPWLAPFNPSATSKEVFHGEKGDKEVDFMHKVSQVFHYKKVSGCTFVNLPYMNTRYAMLVAIPDDMSKVVEKMNVLEFQNILKELKRGGEVSLALPKFKVEYTRLLNPIITQMGAGQVFTSQADLSGITEEEAFVSKALQKCVVEVSEEGSEAAAVTAILIGRSAVRQEPVVIRVDKPFLFAIYDTKTQSILFAGKIADIN